MLSKLENAKPENATYKLVTGQDLKIGDIIVYNHERLVITSVYLGSGAGSFDFGEYVLGYAQKLTGQLGVIEFWTFRTCPMIVKVSCKGDTSVI